MHITKALAAAMIKSAAPGVPARMMGRMIPMEGRRTELAPDEEKEIAEGKSQWLPKILQHEDTPIPRMMASPAKSGLIQALIGALAGGAAGAGIGYGADRLRPGADSSMPLMMALGAGTVALGMGLHKVKEQSADNAHKEEAIRRLPPHSTKRDYTNSEMLLDAMKNRYGR